MNVSDGKTVPYVSYMAGDLTDKRTERWLGNAKLGVKIMCDGQLRTVPGVYVGLRASTVFYILGIALALELSLSQTGLRMYWGRGDVAGYSFQEFYRGSHCYSYYNSGLAVVQNTGKETHFYRW